MINRNEMIGLILEDTPGYLSAKAAKALEIVPDEGLVRVFHKMHCPTFYPQWVQFLQTGMNQYLPMS